MRHSGTVFGILLVLGLFGLTVVLVVRGSRTQAVVAPTAQRQEAAGKKQDRSSQTAPNSKASEPGEVAGEGEEGSHNAAPPGALRQAPASFSLRTTSAAGEPLEVPHEEATSPHGETPPAFGGPTHQNPAQVALREPPFRTDPEIDLPESFDPYEPAEPLLPRAVPAVTERGSGPEAVSLARAAGTQPAESNTPPAPKPPPPPRFTRYTVKAGDSLWSIAVEHLGDGTKWPELLKANPALPKQGTALRIGQVIRIPVGSVEDAPRDTPPAAVKYYVIQAGDTLWDLSEKFYGDTSLGMIKKILAANAGLDPRALPIGKKLRLPVVPGKGPQGL